MGVITALHGFLGLPSDWDFLPFPKITPPLDAIPPAGDTLLGYSMGGRLALHALLGGATYKRAIIAAARVSEAETGRRERDEAWAQRFERDDWQTLMRDWNAQPLFGGHETVRIESDFDRRALADALRRWSSGTLPPLAPRLYEIDIPILWVAGERDAKYVAEGKLAVERTRKGELWICPGAGHRVPWEQPARFIDRIGEFLEHVDDHS